MPPSSSQDPGPDNVIAFPVSAADGDAFFKPFARSAPTLLEPLADAMTFVVRAELEGVEPTVWRRLELAGDLTLAQVHEVLQAAMPWNNSHLHSFLIGPGERDHRVAPFVTDLDLEEGEDGIPERDVRLDQVVREVGDCLYYEYDFGDAWDHRLRVEEVVPRRTDAARVACTDGARACPPDDVGGVPGYDAMLEALAGGPVDDWTLARLDRLPHGFDPDAFDVVRTDERVRLSIQDVSTDGLTPKTLELLDRMAAGGRHAVRPWVATATRRPAEFGEALPAALVVPWLALLDHVGDGLRLTGAGYLTPASVTHLLTVLDGSGRVEPSADTVFGKGNREEHVRPVAWLRKSAQATGLVRKGKGMLLPTAAGRACHADPSRLLLHLADRLPLGREGHQHDAGRLVLLAAAAGVDPTYDDLAGFMAQAGWLVDDAPPPRWAAREWSRTTSEVLQLAGWNPGPYGVLAHDERASLLALLAVRARD